MASLEALDSVVVWVREPAKAREFYTRALGLKVRDDMPGWLTVQPRGGGSEVALVAPDPARPGYEAARASLGGNTGLGFEVGDLKGTLELLQGRGVGITWANLDPEAPGGLHATLEDQDGNTLMLFQPTTKAKGKPGLDRLSFVNVVVRDGRAARDFYTGSLGLAEGEELPNAGWLEVRAAKGAGVGLLEPVEELYEEPADFEEDMRHLGEATGITFTTRDLDALHEELRGRGVQFTAPPATMPWGRRAAEFRDPDGNTFTVMEQAPPRRAGEARKAAKAKAKPKSKARAKPTAARKPVRKAAGRKPAPRRAGAKRKR